MDLEKILFLNLRSSQDNAAKGVFEAKDIAHKENMARFG